MGTEKVINFAPVNNNIQQFRTAPPGYRGNNKMKKSEYREKSATAEGRKNLHTELLSEIKKRMDLFAENAPEANRAKVIAMFDRAMNKMEDMGNSTLFNFFAMKSVAIKIS